MLAGEAKSYSTLDENVSCQTNSILLAFYTRPLKLIDRIGI